MSSLNSQNKFYMKIFQFFFSDRAAFINVLVANGANVNLRSDRGMTPLHYAAAWGKPNGF